jgi:hypothetical protein
LSKREERGRETEGYCDAVLVAAPTAERNGKQLSNSIAARYFMLESRAAAAVPGYHGGINTGSKDPG